MNARARSALFVGIRLTGVPWLVRQTIQRRRVTFLMYHDVAPGAFRQHVRALRRRYAIVPLSEYLSSRKSGSPLPDRSLVITFDDGHRRNAELVDVLRDEGVPVTIFLVSGVVGTHRRFWFKHGLSAREKQALKEVPNRVRLSTLEKAGFTDATEFGDRQALSGEEIQGMRQYVDFQAHTVSHPILTMCGDDEAQREIVTCRKELERRFALRTRAFAYPDGAHSPKVAEMTKDAGFECALTTEPGYADDETDLFRVPRFGVNDEGGASELIVTASGVWSAIRPALKRLVQFIRPR